MITDSHLLFNKKAVVLFNLGGPGSLDLVEGFLFNLFNDKAIITLPNPFRWMLAKYITKNRLHEAKEIYSQMGGKSPILDNTLLQADGLQNLLSTNDNFIDKKNQEYRVFIAMRYSEPRAVNTLKQVIEWNPDEVILLPLYPQYSTTTTQSSFDEWENECKLVNFDKKTTKILNYHTNTNFIKAHVDSIKKETDKIDTKYRILFSAHSLPQKIINKGDPYQKQIIETVEHIMKFFPSNTDYEICYQSKVGRLKWLEPSTIDAIKKAGNDKIGLVIVPIAFVSEHSETLVELDLEYRELAHDHGIPFYIRIPAVGINEFFLQTLKELCYS